MPERVPGARVVACPAWPRSPPDEPACRREIAARRACMRARDDARRPGLWHRGRVSVAAANTAFQRFVEALNRSRDEAALHAAVADDVRIDRHAPGERGTAPIAETFTGVAEVARWVLRMPLVVGFSLAGPAWPDGADRWGVEYAYHAGEFHNGGIWIAGLAGDGRIAFLSHHPFALR